MGFVLLFFPPPRFWLLLRARVQPGQVPPLGVDAPRCFWPRMFQHPGPLLPSLEQPREGRQPLQPAFGACPCPQAPNFLIFTHSVPWLKPQAQGTAPPGAAVLGNKLREAQGCLREQGPADGPGWGRVGWALSLPRLPRPRRKSQILGVSRSAREGFLEPEWSSAPSLAGSGSPSTEGTHFWGPLVTSLALPGPAALSSPPFWSIPAVSCSGMSWGIRGQVCFWGGPEQDWPHSPQEMGQDGLGTIPALPGCSQRIPRGIFFPQKTQGEAPVPWDAPLATSTLFFVPSSR